MLNTVWVYVLSWFKSIREVWFAFLFFCQPIKESWPASHSPIHHICVNMVVLLLLINWLDNLCFSGIFLVNDFSGLKKCLNLNTKLGLIKLGLRKPRQM